MRCRETACTDVSRHPSRFAERLVVAVGVEGQLSEQFAVLGHDPDVEVPDEDERRDAADGSTDCHRRAPFDWRRNSLVHPGGDRDKRYAGHLKRCELTVAIDLSTPTMTEARFNAMGSDAHLVLVGGTGELLRLGRLRVEQLERRWSRFLDDSEITALNRHAGSPVVVSPDTFDLVEWSLAAWQRTEGRFDPTVGESLIAHGYDRDFAHVAATTSPTVLDSPAVPTPAEIELDREAGAPSRCPPESASTPAVSARDSPLTSLPAPCSAPAPSGAMVNLGGDLRVIGQPPHPEGWPITVPDPLHPHRELLRLALRHGAVATSSRLKRRWHTTSGDAHHLIDPATGRSSQTSVAAVTVIAGRLGGPRLSPSPCSSSARAPSRTSTTPMIVTSDGRRHASRGLQATLR